MAESVGESMHRLLNPVHPEQRLGLPWIDAIVVITRGDRSLTADAELARSVGTRLIVIANPDGLRPAIEAELLACPGVDITIINVPALERHQAHPIFIGETNAEHDVLSGVAHARNFALASCRLAGMTCIVIKDDDTEVAKEYVYTGAQLLTNPGRSAAAIPVLDGALDRATAMLIHQRLAEYQRRYPSIELPLPPFVDTSQHNACGGLLIINPQTARMFSPYGIYDEDWFSIFSMWNTKEVAITGRCRQKSFNPFTRQRIVDQVRGEIASGGVLKLLKEGRTLGDGDEAFWQTVIDDHTAFYRRLHAYASWLELQLTGDDATEVAMFGQLLVAALDEVATIDAASLLDYLRRWRHHEESFCAAAAAHSLTSLDAAVEELGGEILHVAEHAANPDVTTSFDGPKAVPTFTVTATSVGGAPVHAQLDARLDGCYAVVAILGDFRGRTDVATWAAELRRYGFAVAVLEIYGTEPDRGRLRNRTLVELGNDLHTMLAGLKIAVRDAGHAELPIITVTDGFAGPIAVSRPSNVEGLVIVDPASSAAGDISPLSAELQRPNTHHTGYIVQTHQGSIELHQQLVEEYWALTTNGRIARNRAGQVQQTIVTVPSRLRSAIDFVGEGSQAANLLLVNEHATPPPRAVAEAAHKVLHRILLYRMGDTRAPQPVENWRDPVSKRPHTAEAPEVNQAHGIAGDDVAPKRFRDRFAHAMFNSIGICAGPRSPESLRTLEDMWQGFMPLESGAWPRLRRLFAWQRHGNDYGEATIHLARPDAELNPTHAAYATEYGLIDIGPDTLLATDFSGHEPHRVWAIRQHGKQLDPIHCDSTELDEAFRNYRSQRRPWSEQRLTDQTIQWLRQHSSGLHRCGIDLNAIANDKWNVAASSLQTFMGRRSAAAWETSVKHYDEWLEEHRLPWINKQQLRVLWCRSAGRVMLSIALIEASVALATANHVSYMSPLSFCGAVSFETAAAILKLRITAALTKEPPSFPVVATGRQLPRFTSRVFFGGHGDSMPTGQPFSHDIARPLRNVTPFPWPTGRATPDSKRRRFRRCSPK